MTTPAVTTKQVRPNLTQVLLDDRHVGYVAKTRLRGPKGGWVTDFGFYVGLKVPKYDEIGWGYQKGQAVKVVAQIAAKRRDAGFKACGCEDFGPEENIHGGACEAV